MNNKQSNEHSSTVPNGSDEDFEFMGDVPKEDPVIVERRRIRNNEITKRLGNYLLKGYCMLGDACPQCDCILLRTPKGQLLCVGCAEIDVENAPGHKETKTGAAEDDEKRVTSAQSVEKKKDRAKRSKQRHKKTPSTSEGDHATIENTNYSSQLESKLKWAVDELAKTQSPNRISAMCTVIIKLTESIKALKEYETPSK